MTQVGLLKTRRASLAAAQSVGRIVSCTALLITVIAVFVPFSPNMPLPGIDPAWKYGLNQAVAQRLSFGEDIVFPLGPYASLYTKAYHPATDHLTIFGSLYLALSYAACFLFVMRRVNALWILAYCGMLAGLLMSWQDPLFLSYPLLAGLAVSAALPLEHGRWARKTVTTPALALLFAPFGLLVLVKTSLLPLCTAVAASCAVLFASRKHKLRLLICVFLPPLSTVLFWIASGQRLAALPHYFANAAPLISGYTEAMALQGNPWEPVLYLGSALVIVAAILVQSHLAAIDRILLGVMYFVFLLLSFKLGFVRHDTHALLAASAILLAALLLSAVCRTQRAPSVILAVLACFVIEKGHLGPPLSSVGKQLLATYQDAWTGVTNRLRDESCLDRQFNAANLRLREHMPIPTLQGTTDIYSFNQAFLIASGNSWSPRPVFQSYTAYTPCLVEANREHLVGTSAPDNIIFRVEPIDSRLPSIEDGASWPVLLRNYAPVSRNSFFLLLRKRNTEGQAGHESETTMERHAFGETVALPGWRKAILARIEIEPTIVGRMAEVLFKPPELWMTLELCSGATKQYRIVPGMVKSGFVISPLVENFVDFSMLYDDDIGELDRKRVKSIAIGVSDGGRSIFWKNEYTVRFVRTDGGS